MSDFRPTACITTRLSDTLLGFLAHIFTSQPSMACFSAWNCLRFYFCTRHVKQKLSGLVLDSLPWLLQELVEVSTKFSRRLQNGLEVSVSKGDEVSVVYGIIDYLCWYINFSLVTYCRSSFSRNSLTSMLVVSSWKVLTFSSHTRFTAQNRYTSSWSFIFLTCYQFKNSLPCLILW